MATYKETVGTSVVNYAGTYPGAVEGELWYDSTNKDFKYEHQNVTTVGAWATGGDMNTDRRRLAGAGTYTAAFGAAGENPPQAKPAVCVPIPANFCLAVFKSFPSAHDDPSYSSDKADTASVDVI